MSPRWVHCIFCDDVRTEVGNKLSLMGVYNGEINFPEGIPDGSPVLIPKLCMVWWLYSDIDDKPERLTFRVFGPPGRQELVSASLPLEQLVAPAFTFPDATKSVLGANFSITNIILPHEGLIEASLETERDTIRVGRLRVRIPGRPEPQELRSELANLSPTVLSQPSEQSPLDVPGAKPERAPRRPRSHQT